MATLAVALAGPALAQRTVTLRLNTATMPDTVAAGPAADVQVRGQLGSGTALPGGGVIDWNDNTTLRPTNDGGDYWSIDFQIPDDDQLSFKFYVGQSEGENLPGGWEEGGDQVVPAGTGDVMLDLHYFEKVAGDQEYDWRPFAADGDSVAVWFRVYADTDDADTRDLTIDDAGLQVGARGNFGTLGAVDSEGAVVDWGDGGETDTGVTLTRESDDAARPGFRLFSGVAKFPASSVGETVNYKFFFTDSDVSGDGGYESGDNRTFVIPAAGADTTLHWVFYSNSPANTGSNVTSNVTFQVDVSPLTSIGLFQISDDFVQTRGGFNGWDCPDDNQDDCLLQQIPGTADFARQVPVTSAPGSALPYKFYIDFRNPEGGAQFQNALGEDLDVGWEEPLDTGGGDRTFSFAGSDQTIEEQFFNSVRSGNVIADGQSVDVTFMVDMSEALSFTDTEGRTFNPAVDTVSVQFEDTVWRLTQGIIPGSDDEIDTGSGGSLFTGFKLTDDDGDGVYTGVLTVNGPTYNGIGYRYTFGNDTDGLQVEGEGGFDAGRRRYRYITDVAASEFAFALDTFRPANARTPWEVNPTGSVAPGDLPFSIANGEADGGIVTANEDGPGQSGTLALGAVYPNPTTGLARFAVTSAPDELVTIRVYDVTGRVVADVVEGGAVSGRVLEVDTAGMAAGLYLVRAESAAGVAVRRLTVVR